MRVLRILGLAAALVLVLNGCGGEDEEQEATGPSIKTIEISETEFELEPPTVRLDRAGTYTFRVVNKGTTDHALEIEGEGSEEETENIAPGATAELTVELDGGEYELYCPVGDHKDQGMTGTLSVATPAGGEKERPEGSDY